MITDDKICLDDKRITDTFVYILKNSNYFSLLKCRKLTTIARHILKDIPRHTINEKCL